MAAPEVSAQEVLVQSTKLQSDPTSSEMQADGLVMPPSPDPTDLAASAPEASIPFAGQHEASTDPADDQAMEDIPEPPSADEELAESTSQTSQGLQLPPQQLHSRLSQVPAYAQLPQVSESWFPMQQAACSLESRFKRLPRSGYLPAGWTVSCAAVPALI